jgi:hypothetical protein
MSQPITVQAANNRSSLRIGQIIFTVLALLSFALGSILLSLVWFGVGVTSTGKDFYADAEVRAFVFIVIWPAIMLAVWIFSTLTLLLAKRWLLASLSLPVAFAILFAIWWFVAVFMLNISGVMFTALFILLNTGAIWLASWFCKQHVKTNV